MMANAKADEKWPVRSTRNPVIAGPITPARFPTKFWKPTHRPAAVGPANVCADAKSVDDPRPNATPVNSRHALETSGVLATTTPTKQTAVPS